jgi:predicted nucleic acid-binding Zn ribbon protein
MSGTASRLCFACGNAVDPSEQFVLTNGRGRQPHCSESCVYETLRKRRRARLRARMRLGAVGALVVAALAAGWTLRRHRLPHARSISMSWVDTKWDAPPPIEPNYYGPAWPPTDDDWMFAFDRATWVYPLPGPTRHAPVADERLFATDPKGRAPSCRQPGVCGVDLGGELWGEHVYAAAAGVVDRSISGGGDEHGGGYVRIAHFGGMVFTHYFHLAAIPRGVVRGARISAGEVIGLVGDTGTASERSGPRTHLHFAFSIRPSAEFGDTFWDPSPLMAKWPLHVPPHGSVAGLVAATNQMEIPRRHRAR